MSHASGVGQWSEGSGRVELGVKALFEESLLVDGQIVAISKSACNHDEDHSSDGFHYDVQRN